MNGKLTLLKNYLDLNDASASIGEGGAIAEFEGKPLTTSFSDNGQLLILTSEFEFGALRANIDTGMGIEAIESLSSNMRTWNQRILISSVVNGKKKFKNPIVLTEIGNDIHSLRKTELNFLNFDLGAGLACSKFLVRTNDISLIKVLRNYAGQNILIEGHPALEKIIDRSPTRVMISNKARIEVFQKISRIKTPRGPHTHLLPVLIKNHRKNQLKFPENKILNQLTLYPKQKRKFEEKAYLSCENFDKLIKVFGNQEYLRQKVRVTNAIEKRIPFEKFKKIKRDVSSETFQIALLQSIKYFNKHDYAMPHLIKGPRHVHD